MDVLSIVHGEDAGPELFGPLVAEAGHRRDDWSFESGSPPPLDAYDAVLVFGGFMHPDQDDLFPWLSGETDWLRGLVEQQVPTLRELGSQAEEAYAFFNNNSTSQDPVNPLGRIAQAADGAHRLRTLLDMNGIPAAGGA